MIRVAIMIKAVTEGKKVAHELIAVLKGTRTEYFVDIISTRINVQRLADGKTPYEVLILDMDFMENADFRKKLLMNNREMQLVLWGNKDIRHFMQYKPRLFFCDYQDFYDNMGFIANLFITLREQSNVFVLRINREIIEIPYWEIILMETTGRNVSLYVHNRVEPYLLTESMQNLYEKLPETSFLFCHQSIIVNMKYIKRVLPKENPAYPAFEMKNERYIPISKRKRETSLKAYHDYLNEYLLMEAKKY